MLSAFFVRSFFLACFAPAGLPAFRLSFDLFWAGFAAVPPALFLSGRRLVNLVEGFAFSFSNILLRYFNLVLFTNFICYSALSRFWVAHLIHLIIYFFCEL